jgi:hypothetical protein
MWSRNMPNKHLLTISLLLPLAAISATAQAGSTISDRSYWPSEAKQTAPIGISSRADVSSAFAYDRTTSSPQPTTGASGVYSPWRYEGGPKGR